MSTWQREYKHRGRHIFPRIFVGCVLGILGLVFLLLMPPIGILMAILAIGVPIAMAQLGQDITILAQGTIRYSGSLKNLAPSGQLEPEFFCLTSPDGEAHV